MVDGKAKWLQRREGERLGWAFVPVIGSTYHLFTKEVTKKKG